MTLIYKDKKTSNRNDWDKCAININFIDKIMDQGGQPASGSLLVFPFLSYGAIIDLFRKHEVIAQVKC